MVKNKICLITGASGGIGGALAKNLESEGYSLILHGRNKQNLSKLASELENEHIVIIGDLTNSTDQKRLLDEAFAVGNVDLLVNNAGMSSFADFETLSKNNIEQLIQINLLAPIVLTQKFIKKLSGHSSTIINVGSALGSIGFPGFSLYSATKFGLRGFSESLSRELSDSNIRVGYFAPRTTKTTANSTQADAMNNALGNKIDSPEWVAKEFISFLKSNRSRKVLGWPEKLFARINGMFPWLVDNAINSKLNKIKQYS